jgi:hypothetical protein
MEVAITLCLASLGSLLFCGKGLKGRVLMRKCPSTSTHVRAESFCRSGDGNGSDFESVLT